MSIDFSFFIALFMTMPSVVVLSVCIGFGGRFCTISSSACCAGMSSLQFMYMDTSSDSASEDMTVLMICAIVRISPLFGGSGESLDMNKCPRYASSVCLIY